MEICFCSHSTNEFLLLAHAQNSMFMVFFENPIPPFYASVFGHIVLESRPLFSVWWRHLSISPRAQFQIGIANFYFFFGNPFDIRLRVIQEIFEAAPGSNTAIAVRAMLKFGVVSILRCLVFTGPGVLNPKLHFGIKIS